MKGGGVASVALLLVAVVLAVVGGGDDAGGEQGAPQIILPADLVGAAEEVGHEIYWAGRRGRARLELSVEPDGSVYLRYLSRESGAEDPDGDVLTVGTYPVPDAPTALRRAARQSGGTLGRVKGGGLTLESPTSPRSVYLSFPGSDLQIEVYDPRPGRALELVRSGAIEPVSE